MRAGTLKSSKLLFRRNFVCGINEVKWDGGTPLTILKNTHFPRLCDKYSHPGKSNSCLLLCLVMCLQLVLQFYTEHFQAWKGSGVLLLLISGGHFPNIISQYFYNFVSKFM